MSSGYYWFKGVAPLPSFDRPAYVLVKHEPEPATMTQIVARWLIAYLQRWAE